MIITTELSERQSNFCRIPSFHSVHFFRCLIWLARQTILQTAVLKDRWYVLSSVAIRKLTWSPGTRLKTWCFCLYVRRFCPTLRLHSSLTVSPEPPSKPDSCHSLPITPMRLVKIRLHLPHMDFCLWILPLSSLPASSARSRRCAPLVSLLIQVAQVMAETLFSRLILVRWLESFFKHKAAHLITIVNSTKLALVSKCTRVIACWYYSHSVPFSFPA